MTAEIAIMNKTAVALAADSAVTIGQDKKIFNTVNKLFALSKYHPVGLMIYGNALFMDVPWESIIKIYRAKLGTKKRLTLHEYADDFIFFLLKNETLFPESEQGKHFIATINNYFKVIRNKIDEQSGNIINKNHKIDEKEVDDIVTSIIKKHFDRWNKLDKLSHIPDNYESTLISKYGKIIEDIKNKIFEKLPISNDSFIELKTICSNIYSKDLFSDNHSGVVIAGFGEDDTFPHLVSYKIETKFNGALKYKEERQGAITHDNAAWIIPFAQKEMVATFMEGVDPSYDKLIFSYLSEYFNKYPEYIFENIDNADAKRKNEFVLKDIGKKVIEEFKKNLKEYRRHTHVDPIIEAVAALPKDELAAMAESLVNLTSFKRKISLDAETVGGPIDVAVISKGDGFIWIKRKHYFKPELNAGFFANYYREISEVQDDGKG